MVEPPGGLIKLAYRLSVFGVIDNSVGINCISSLSFAIPILIYIQVAQQVRTVPVRGCDAEQDLVLRSVI